MSDLPTVNLEDFGIDKKAEYWKKFAAEHSHGASVSAAPPRPAWQVLLDHVHDMMSSAGSGINSAFVRGNEADREDDLIRQQSQQQGQTPQQAEATIRQNQAQRAAAIQERRAQRQLLETDENRRRSRMGKLGAGLASMAGDIIGDINPTYAIPALGESVAARMAAMGGITGGSDILSQIDEYDRKIRNHFDPVETATSAVAGAAFQGAGEAVAKGIGKLVTFRNGRAILKGLMDRGLTPEQAKGVTAGVVAESGANPTALNKSSGAMGYGQWLGSRKDELIRRYGPHPTHDQQLDFLVHELKGGDAGGPKVLANNDSHSVLSSYIKDFMRPAKGKETTGDLRRGSDALGGSKSDHDKVDEEMRQLAHNVENDPEHVKAYDDFIKGRINDDEYGEIYRRVLAQHSGDGASVVPIEQLRRSKDHQAASDEITRFHDEIYDLTSDVINNGKLVDVDHAEATRSEINDELRKYQPHTEEHDKLLDIDDMLKQAIAYSGGKPRIYAPDATESFMASEGPEAPANINIPLEGPPHPPATSSSSGSVPKRRNYRANKPENELKGPDGHDETFRSRPGVNARRMAKMLGPQLYGDPSEMGPTSIKEVLQNSYDAIKTALSRGSIKEGKIDIHTDEHSRTITMHDNGVGMTPDILGGKFLEIAGSGKEEGASSGGFGIAKMLFLYGNKKLHVTTIRDGKVAELRTSGDELFNALDDPSRAPNITVRHATEMDKVNFPNGHGTRIEMEIPKDFSNPVTGEKEKIDFPRYDWDAPSVGKSPLFAPVEVTWNGYPMDRIGKHFPADEHKTFANVDFGWGKADIYVTHTPSKSFGDNVHILSNGLHQFDMTLKKDANTFGPAIPHQFNIDIHPKVKPDEPGYPFSFNRKNLTEEAKKELNGVLDYVKKVYALESLEDESKSFGTVQYMDPHSGEITGHADLKPDVPFKVDGLRGIQEGDKVEVKDGRMFVNGKELPAMTPEQLKNAIPSHEELRVNPKLINPDQIMIHNNAYIPAEKVGEFGHDIPVIGYMRQEFGKRFDEFLHATGGAFKQLRDMVADLGADYEPLRKHAVGLSFNPEYRGVNIKVPFDGMFLNPLTPESYKNVVEQAYGMIGTMIHELAHFKVRSHNSKFPAEMQTIMYKLYASNHFHGWQMDVVHDISQFEDIIKHGQELFDRGDVISGDNTFKDGVKGFESTGRDARSVEGIDRSGGEGQRPEEVSGDSGERAEPAASSSFGTVGPEGINRRPSEKMKAAEGHGGEGHGGEGGEETPEPQRPILKKQKKLLVDKLGDAIEQGKPLRREAEAAIMKERARRLAAVYKTRKTKGGEQGFYAELASLKGEMGRPKVESIRHWFTQQEVDQLYDIVKNSPALQGYETINAQAALKKLLGHDYGEIPTAREIELLAKAMPAKTKIWRQLLENEEGSLNLGAFPENAIVRGTVNVAGLTRTLKASFDVSAPGRQGMFLIGSKHWWKSLPGQFKAFASEGAFNKIQQEIFERPTYGLMNRAGLQTTRNNAGMIDREEAFISQFAEAIPGVRNSERAYIAFLNKLRADMFDDFVAKGEKLGIDFIHDPHYLKSAARFINSATGRGDLGTLGRNGQLLGNVLFSPKLMKSRIDLLNPFYYASLHPKVRLEAAKHGLIYAGTVLGILGLAAAGGATIERDMRSSDFAKIKIGNTRFDVTGGFQPYVRFYAQQITGQQKGINDGIMRNVGTTLPFIRAYFPGVDQGAFKPTTRLDLVYRFFENKESPNAAEVTRLLREHDAVGNPLGQNTNPISDLIGHATGESSKVGNEAVELFTPLIISDTYQAYNDLGAKGLLTAIPNAAGVGVQTYTPKKKTKRVKLSDFGDVGTVNLKDFQ
jgi:hypothetical protein